MRNRRAHPLAMEHVFIFCDQGEVKLEIERDFSLHCTLYINKRTIINIFIFRLHSKAIILLEDRRRERERKRGRVQRRHGIGINPYR